MKSNVTKLLALAVLASTSLGGTAHASGGPDVTVAPPICTDAACTQFSLNPNTVPPEVWQYLQTYGQDPTGDWWTAAPQIVRDFLTPDHQTHATLQVPPEVTARSTQTPGNYCSSVTATVKAFNIFNMELYEFSIIEPWCWTVTTSTAYITKAGPSAVRANAYLTWRYEGVLDHTDFTDPSGSYATAYAQGHMAACFLIWCGIDEYPWVSCTVYPGTSPASCDGHALQG